MQRRRFLSAGGAAAVLALMPFRSHASDVKLALTNSDLVYLTPIKADGSLSSCQAEVWYIMLGPDVYICTASSSWRAKAAGSGINNTKLWIGDLGGWHSEDYKSLPSINAVSHVESDETNINRVLAQFGRKYSAQWSTWGPRFKNGLADGSRKFFGINWWP